MGFDADVPDASPADQGDHDGDGNLVSDRERWNERYRLRPVGRTPLLLRRHLQRLPRSGLAIDVAGGAGDAAVTLAARGLSVTVADVSDVALELAAERADRARVSVETRRIDLSVDPFPAGPWNLITCFHFLDRRLFPAMIASLAPGGTIAVAIATKRNLERHQRPPGRFLLEDGELPGLLAGLELELYREEWNLEGRHEAEAIARLLP